jgi:ferredoxin
MWDESKCDLCGDCLVRCQYVDYDREKAVQQIDDLKNGEPAEILKECVTCCACNEYCPTGANPFDLINRMQEEKKSLPIPDKMVAWMGAGATLPTEIIQGDRSKPALSLCVMERSIPEKALGGQMFEGMTIAKGGDYFCYLGFVHIGMASPLADNARKFVDQLSSLGSEEIVFIHPDCYAMLSKMGEFGISVPFKATYIIQYMRDYLKDHRGSIVPLGQKIAFQRPCASRYIPEMEPVLDELFDLIGIERVERRYDREEALCCMGMLARVDPERTKRFQDMNLQDAVDSGAEAMVFLCPFCHLFLGKQAHDRGLQPIFLTELVRMALGEIPSPAIVK